MAELWRRPRQEEIARVVEQLEDPLTFWWFNRLQKWLNSSKEPINFPRQEFEDWKSITRRLLNYGKYVLLFTELERINDEVKEKVWTDFEIPKYYPPTFKKNIYKDVLKNQVKITEIAKRYGLKLKGNQSICPFHKDKKPSLSFSDDKGVFHCFGCGVKGDVLTFIKLMEELNGHKRRSK